MLFVVKPGREEALMERFRRWGLQAAVVGRVLAENVVRVLQAGQVAAEVPASALADDTPINHHLLLESPPAEIQEHWKWQESSLPVPTSGGVVLPSGQFSWGEVLLRLLDDPTIASKRWIWRQYDHQVQANTVVPPGGADAAVVRLRPQQGEGAMVAGHRGVAAVVDCPNRWVALDPERGGMAAVAEAARNLSCVGAEPLAVTDNLNFPSPDTDTGYWQLAQACRGLSQACLALATPVTGGNVSLYNETRLPDGRIQPIQPTPVVGMVGLVSDLNRVRGMGWRQPGDAIWLLGLAPESGVDGSDDRISLAGSTYQSVIHGLCTGRPPRIDLELEARLQELLRRAIAADLVGSAHDLSDGGLAVAAAEACLAGGLGASLELPASGVRRDRLLFAESAGRVLVSVPVGAAAGWRQLLSEAAAVGVPTTLLGEVVAQAELKLTIGAETLLRLPLDSLRDSFEGGIPRRLGANPLGDLPPTV
jgi:phosphoribosylformylglycinamidine synthase